ncbi:hypothetical protein CBR_g32450 [Chara braunii]|uniref:Uncharacterized protein n=1 Tax=Chara braunii TaxID=69332 RepID=A0A388LGK6_CHABU|nr:hypothetical protein CBR_g32450 [Chara braunii]|eukprot:GBG81460.1 hypothetical protein CBR_g32450 [Chara braunii]
MAVERAFLGSVLQLPGCQGLTDKAVALATSPGTSHSAMRVGTGLHVNSAGAHKAVLLAAHVTSPGIEDNARQDLCGTHLKGVGSSRLRRVRSRGSKRGSGFFRDCVGNRSRLHVIAAGMENAGAGRGPSRGIPPKATPASPSSPVTRSQAESLREQNQRLLAMQQELLEQVCPYRGAVNTTVPFEEEKLFRLLMHATA